MVRWFSREVLGEVRDDGFRWRVLTQSIVMAAEHFSFFNSCFLAWVCLTSETESENKREKDG